MTRCIDETDGGDTEKSDADGEHAVIQLQPARFRPMPQFRCQPQAERANVPDNEAADDASKHQ